MARSPEHEALWRKIRNFSLDPPDARGAFAAKLARSNGWSLGYAQRVVKEYKRFVLLYLIAGHEVSPSDAIDQAWHQHLLDTRNYWGEFCPNILGRPLHHVPAIKPDQAEKFRADYAQTLDSYQRIFARTPPRDIWPIDGGHGHFVRINHDRFWFLPRRPLTALGRLLPLLALCVLPGCANQNILDLRGPDFIRLYTIIVVAALALCALLRWALAVPYSPRAGAQPPQNAYEAAYLAGGPHRVVATTLARLLDQDIITLDASDKGMRLSETGARKLATGFRLNSLERAALEALDSSRGRLQNLPRTMAGAIDNIRQRLAERGFVIDAPGRALLFLVQGAIMLSTLGIGAAKCYIGIMRDKPIGFLIVGMIITAIAAFFALRRTPRISRAGAAALATLQRDHAALKDCYKKSSYVRTQRQSEQPEMAVALFGFTAVSGIATIYTLDSLLQPPRPTSDWSIGSDGCSSGGGDGGGCGGGGCGGCGGD